ncbi:MAG: hypothetical protein E6Q26_06145 [Acinetobacter sp.]|jgi:hypothetical protein|nr:hypothetical protein [Elizabethkingia anophelis]MDV4086339.1 hypothetical protein [Elizabethkingia anophelis]TXJ02000.1 MAG: hypothetical protein E6Q26_06145 [Acinetobacter sp.]
MIRTEKTLSEVMALLSSQGYTEDYNLLQLRGSRDNQSNEIDFANLVIDKIYRFSGQNDAADEAILYSISNLKNGLKGLFVNGYGIYTDEEASTIIEKISLNTLDYANHE